MSIRELVALSREYLAPEGAARLLLFSAAAVSVMLVVQLYTGEGAVGSFAFAALALIALWGTTIITLSQIARLKRRNAVLQKRDSGFANLLDRCVAEWRLTRAERDVVLLTFKGMSISEIAALRDSSFGTVKAQLSCAYHKSGVGSRSELVFLVMNLYLDGRYPDSGIERTPAPRSTAVAPAPTRALPRYPRGRTPVPLGRTALAPVLGTPEAAGPRAT